MFFTPFTSVGLKGEYFPKVVCQNKIIIEEVLNQEIYVNHAWLENSMHFLKQLITNMLFVSSNFTLLQEYFFMEV